MRLLLLLALLLSVPSFAQQKDKPIITKLKNHAAIVHRYDRVTEESLIVLRDIGGKVAANAFAGVLSSVRFKGQQLTKETPVRWAFGVEVASSGRLPIFTAPQIFILYDGKRTTIETDRQFDLEQPRDRAPAENRLIVGAVVKPELYQEIARSKDVEIRVDKYEFKLSAETLENMCSLVSYVQDLAGGAK